MTEDQRQGAEDRCQEVEDGWPWACGGRGEFGEGEWQAPINGFAALPGFAAPLENDGP